jgi:hypothetical protein
VNAGDVMNKTDTNGPKMPMEKEFVTPVMVKSLIGMQLLKTTWIRNVVDLIMKNSPTTTIPNVEKKKTVKVSELHTMPQENVSIVPKDAKNAEMVNHVTNVSINSDGMMVNAKNALQDVNLVPVKKLNVLNVPTNTTLTN